MRILVLTDNFVPEHNAPALREFDHCRRWVEQGAEVTVVTGVPNFPTGKVQQGYRNKLYQREVMSGIEVIRVWTYLAPNVGTVRRSIDFVSFAVTSFLAGLFVKCDVIVATSPQLLTGVSGAALAFLRRKPWVFEVRDLWPDSITAVKAMRQGPFISFLRWVEGTLYRRATRIVAVSTALKAAIAKRGIALARIAVIPNGASQRLKTVPKDPALLAKLKLSGKFVVGYVGTHGAAHGLETMILAADKLRDRGDIGFLFVGDGANRVPLQDLTADLGVQNVQFVGPVRNAEVAAYLAICDVLVVPLKNSPIAAGALPSKIFDAAVMERPVLLGVPGIAAELIETYGAGRVFEPENSAALVEAIEAISADRETYVKMQAGCRVLAKDYERDGLADRMLTVLRELVP
ncbi:MAG TPA: glycosyltransferase family 4 protein [Rhizomicrobium sp.]|jgi:glycosyltransferase involved in cell wall biosynthesis|nr:glycosyltransferase family 4 protein [Rhizomicrobium sp.]